MYGSDPLPRAGTRGMAAGAVGSEEIVMRSYRLDVLVRPTEGLPDDRLAEEQLGFRRVFGATGDKAAIAEAKKRFERLAAMTELDRFVLYEGERVVHEHVPRKRRPR